MLERGLWPCLADLSFWVARQRGSHAAPGGRRGAPVSGSSGDTGTLLLEGLFDFFSGVFEVAFGPQCPAAAGLPAERPARSAAAVMLRSIPPNTTPWNGDMDLQ